MTLATACILFLATTQAALLDDCDGSPVDVAANRKRVPAVLASLGKLAAAGKLQIAMTECGP